MILLFLGRRLPKTPAPPLYFNLSQRLLYWRPTPECYAQLLPALPTDQRDETLTNEGEGPAFTNAGEIGLAEDEDEEKLAEPAPDRIGPEHGSHINWVDPRSAPSSRFGPAEQDVRQGGYPTFSGGGVMDTKRQVPTGVIERGNDGRVLRFVNEDGSGMGQSRAAASAVATGLGSDERNDSRARDNTQGRKSLAPHILANTQDPTQSKGNAGSTIPPGQPPHVSREVASRFPQAQSLQPIRPTQKAQRTQQAQQPQQPQQPQHTKIAKLPRPTLSQAPTHLKPTTKPIRVLSTIDEDSFLSPTSKLTVEVPALGASFPLPPSRSQRQSTASGVDAASAGQGVVHMRNSIDGVGPPAIPRPSLKNARAERNSSAPIAAPVSSTTIQPLLPSREPVLSPPHIATHLAKPKLPHAHSDPTSDQTATLPRSSLTQTTSSPTTTSNDPMRKARGVRFDLRPPSTASISSFSSNDIATPPRSGLRIPGTSITLPIPFSSGPGTPRPRRHSIASISSLSSSNSSDTDGEMEEKADSTRPESSASSSPTATDMAEIRPDMVTRSSSGELDVAMEGRRSVREKAGLPRTTRGATGRPKSVAVLGGGYLDGGNEKRRHSSIDSM